MARRNRGNAKDAIIVVVLVAIVFMYSQGLPGGLIVQVIMFGLLLAAMAYVLISPILDIYRTILDIINRRKLLRIARSNAPVDTMTWQEFEYYVAGWLGRQGYKDVRLTEHYDLGVDIVANKDGVTWGVQVKHYRNLVGIDAVRQVVVGLKKYKCDRAMVVTNSIFSRPAIELAKSQDCVLIDQSSLA
jgi:restriction system protein